MSGTLVGTTLGPYRIDAELGAGGMGRVYRAQVAQRDFGLDPGAAVALKIVHPHLLATPGFFRRFLREAEIGGAIRHDNVVRTYGADAVAVGGVQHHYLVMEFVEGQTLRALLAELERVPEELCRHIGREVAKGLAAIHAAGIVHRDVKPENVLITKEHAVKVMDLGVARLADEALRLSQSGVFVGSVEYAAPEQFRGGDVDHRADLHALGLILYVLATGQHPFRGDDFRAVMRRVLDEKPRRPAEINPQLSPFLEETLLRLLAKDRADRFASAAELAQVLDEGERAAWWRARASEMRTVARRPLRRNRIPRETALYGREAELSKLRALYDAAKSGDGRVVLIEGEAGIGKSRIVDEFVGLLQREGEDLNFLFGSYPPGGAATASGAFSTAYREHFGAESLDQALLAYLAPTPILVPAFAALLRGEPTPAGVEPLTKDSLQTVFAQTSRALAAERPTIVLIDDLHFAPEEGRALFAALALAVPSHRILLVGTMRPGVDEKWVASVDRVGAARVALPRLGARDLVRLLADTLRSDHLAEELGARIALKSDGNPFFVFEILRGLRDGQFLTRKPDGTWATTRVIEDIEIPSSVLELVNARVADLDDEDRNLLDVAACVGFEFDPLLVAQALGIPAVRAMQKLARIEKKHRLVRSAGRRLVFDHHQVQEALYGALLEPLREAYHVAIATALEVRHAAGATEPAALDGEVCVDLAEHLLKGGRGTRVLRYLDAALSHLEKGYVNDAAIRLVDRALAAPGLVAGVQRCDLLVRTVERFELLGRLDERRARLDEALALADAAQDGARRARVRALLGWHLVRVSRAADAERVLEEARSLARDAGDRRTEAEATGYLGLAANSRGRLEEARALHERHLTLAREMGDRRSEAVATGNLGTVLRNQGRFDDARAATARTLALCRETGYRRGEAMATGDMGTVYEALGCFDEARAQFERHAELARAIGYRRGEAIAIGNLGVVALQVGRYGEARSMFERNLARSRELAFREGEALAHANLGDVHIGLGDLTGARRSIETCLDLCRAIGARLFEATALNKLGRLLAERGDEPGWSRNFRDALALRRELGSRNAVAETLCDRGGCLARAGRVDEARTDLAEALALAAELRSPRILVLARVELACLPDGDVAAALAAFAEHEPRLGAPAAMQVRFLLWHATHDRAHLAEARRHLDFVVAHAPPECRESTLANARLHREIAAAVKAAGL